MELLDTLLLHFSSRDKLIRELTENLLQKFANSILGRLGKMIEAESLDKVFKLHRLFDYSQWGKNTFNQKFGEAMSMHLREKAEASKPVEFVGYMLHLYKAIQSYGAGDPSENNLRLKKISETVIQDYIANTRSEKSCAIYIDHHIKNLHNHQETGMASFNEQLIELLKLQRETTHFEFHYKHYMKKRLLSTINPESFLYENQILKILKTYLDEEQVDHMELALVDVKSSLALKSNLISEY